jgi:methylglyoxal synthase
VLYNVPTACNRATADFILASPLVHGEYERIVDAPADLRERLARAG